MHLRILHVHKQSELKTGDKRIQARPRLMVARWKDGVRWAKGSIHIEDHHQISNIG